jgi:hypothetical protein
VEADEQAHVMVAMREVGRCLGAEAAEDPVTLLAAAPSSTGIVLAARGHETVGFSIYRRFCIDEAHGVYRALTLIAPDHQGRGLYGAIRKCVLPDEVADAGYPSFYYAWRTRNPIVWFANARLCRRVVPGLGEVQPDPQLFELARKAAALLLPGRVLEVPAMVMRAVYRPRCCGSEQRHPDARLDAQFRASSRLSDSGDALFAFGELRRKGDDPIDG